MLSPLFRTGIIAALKPGAVVLAPASVGRRHFGCAHQGEKRRRALQCILSGFSLDPDADYAFEMVSSTIRFGVGVTAEIGYDIQNMKAKYPLVMTDKNVAKTRAFTYASL